MSKAFIAVATAFAVACSDGTTVTDGGGSDGALDGALAVTPPDIPWLAVGVSPIAFTPCPKGWREVDDGGVVTCDPYPVAGPSHCGPGEAHFPGEPGCTPLGDPCPAGAFADGLPTDGAVTYVRAGAAAGGNGSFAGPYAALSQVRWSVLPTGTTVALGRGRYPGILPLRAGVRVIGTCAAETIVTGAAGPTAVVTVTTRGEPAVVRNVTIADDPRGGVQVGEGRRVQLEGVAIERNGDSGVYAFGPGTEVSLNNVVVRDTVPTSSGLFGRGLNVESGAHLQATRVLVEGNNEIGVFAGGAGCEVSLSDSVVRDTQSLGHGIHVQNGARVEASRVLVSDNRDVGVSVGGTDSVVTFTDVIVRNTRGDGRGLFGRGITVQDGNHQLEALRLLVEGNREVGLFANGRGTQIVATDVVIRDTQGEESTGEGGHGVNVGVGARLEAVRLLVQRNRGVGLVASDPDTEVVLTDAVIADTHAEQVNGLVGHGVEVLLGARLEAVRFLVERSRGVGLVASDRGTEILVTDALVRDTASQQDDGRLGHGVQVQGGARADVSRVRVVGARACGVASVGDAMLTMNDVVVEDVHVADCTQTTCPEAPFGYGVVTVSSGLQLTRFAIEDAVTCGAFIAGLASALDLESGAVTGSEIGACIQVDGYDLGRLTGGVEFRGNGSNLQNTSLPVPALVDSL